MSSTSSSYSEGDRNIPLGQYCLETKNSRQVGKFFIDKQIGEGGFAVCFLARQRAWGRNKKRKLKFTDRSNNPPVCLKIFNKGQCSEEDQEIYNEAKREFNILDKLRDCHYVINAINLQQFTNANRQLYTYIAFEYYTMDLHEYLNKECDKSGMREHDVRTIGNQILEGLCSLHAKNIVHTDLKLENVLISKQKNELNVALCDLGSAHFIGKELSDYGRTLEFSAPELITETASLITGKTDIFAFACVLYVLLTGADLFNIEEYFEMLALTAVYSRKSTHHPKVKANSDYFHRNGMLHHNYSLKYAHLKKWYDVYAQYFSQELINFMCECTEANPEARINSTKALELFKTLAFFP